MPKLRNLIKNSYFIILLLSAVQLVLVMVINPPLPVQVLRIIIGAPFVLFFPGFCLVAAAFPAREDVDDKARLALSFGLSLVLVPSLALLLDLLPWGITLGSVMLGILALLMLLVAITLLRQRSLPPEARYEPLSRLQPGEAWRGLALKHKLVYLLVAVLVIAFAALAYSILALPSPADRMTEFYLLGDLGMAEGYPYQVTANQPYEIIIGVRNLEGDSHIYQVEARDAAGQIGAAGPFTLADEEGTEFSLPFTPRETGDDVRIDFLLFIDGGLEPYRTLHLYTRVVPSK